MAKGINYAPWERAFDRILTPLEEFIHRQTTAGVLLMTCAVVAIGIGNSSLADSYAHFLHIPFSLGFGEQTFSLSLHHWINEFLMAFFFMLIGLELKRELLVGELASINQALLPLIAAVGGMVVPALVFLLVAGDTEASAGWGIPMATDIAFAVGALSLLGARIPKSLLTFLIALAIVDDLGAVIVIALFYTAEINTTALLTAGIWTLGLVGLNLIGVRRALPYCLLGLLLWSAMLSSGIHATIAGVIVAFTVPIRPKFEPDTFLSKLEDKREKLTVSIASDPDILHNSRFRALVSALGEGVSAVQAPAQRAEHVLHLPVTYIVIPLFALANAAIAISAKALSTTLVDPATAGVMAGLLIGKPLGIFGFTWLACRFRGIHLPEGMTFGHVLGVGLLAGIGFTMAIFIADLAYASDAAILLKAKTGILIASFVAGVTGFALLWFIGHPKRETRGT
jgi:NhaA family Na+:H+ antiporter